MSLVTNKYTPAEMSEQELKATFAAREHTVDYLLKSLRDQIHSGTLSSFVITGPRGAGKSTLIQMVALRIRQDAELKAAWIPLVFPEEQFNMVSLRDMLAATLEALVKDGVPTAQEWLNKVAAEPNEEQSQQLAITGLREVTRQTGKRLILFIENLNQLLEENLDDQMKGTLRRLLMADPVMMIIGSAVHVFESLKGYDEAFFNYFGQVPLDRLNSAQVSEILRKRAAYDGNEQFLRELPQQQAKVKTLVYLTGGNPRFVLMLYELLSLRQVTSIVQYLRRLVDELTPLLKDEMEHLPPQQRKIIHALMEKGGTAQPTNLVGPTRLPLNAITTQLKRLKEAQIVEVLGGGKGRAANYTVPDKLFSIWYQMRYLSQNRRRIELFVEVLRIWFEEDERVLTLRQLAEKAQFGSAHVLRECAMTAEYFAASLRGTIHEQIATDLCIGSWVKADLKEAALAYADLSHTGSTKHLLDEAFAHAQLAGWLSSHGDPQRTINALDQALANSLLEGDKRANALILRGYSKVLLKDYKAAIADCSTAIKTSDIEQSTIASAYFFRGLAKSASGDYPSAIADYSVTIQHDSTSNELVVQAFARRGEAKRKALAFNEAITDLTYVIELVGASKEAVAVALHNRGIIKRQLGNEQSAIEDFGALINLEGAPIDKIAQAMINRGISKKRLGQLQGAIADFDSALKQREIPADQIVTALICRAKSKGLQHDFQAAISDLTTVINLKGVSVENLSHAYYGRGLSKVLATDVEGAINDFTSVVQLEDSPKQLLVDALEQRGYLFMRTNEPIQAVADWVHVLDIGAAAGDALVSCADFAFKLHILIDARKDAEMVISKFAFGLNSTAPDTARHMVVSFLNNLALPEMKAAWPIAWRTLANQLNSGVVEAIRFLEPVCSVLEGKDRALLDALPPEQREFALEVLAKFEPKSKNDEAKAE